MIRTAITSLHRPWFPRAVILLVIPVIVLTFYSVLRERAWSHIRKEVLKAMLAQPPVANSNTSVDVVIRASAVGPTATRSDSLPDFVFGSLSLAMSQPTQKPLFLIVASAGYDPSLLYAVGANVFDDSAFAAASPIQALADIEGIEFRQSGVWNNHGQHYTLLRRISQVDNIVWPAWKHAETGGNVPSLLPEERKESNNAAYMSNGYNLQRFDGGGGTLRMDFTDVKFGEGITWDTHIAIDPDRCYGVNPARIDVYELMKFGAYARDTLQMRQYTSGGTCVINGCHSGDAMKTTELYAGTSGNPAVRPKAVTIRQARTISREGCESGTLNDFTLGSRTLRDDDKVWPAWRHAEGGRNDRSRFFWKNRVTKAIMINGSAFSAVSTIWEPLNSGAIGC